MNNITNLSKDYIFKEIKINNKIINLIYNETQTDIKTLTEIILRLKEKDLNNLNNTIPNITIIKKEEILTNLSIGKIIIIHEDKYFSFELKQLLDRTIPTIESETTLTGPKDSFTENYNTNIGLIRKRLKTTDLYIDSKELGKYTKTKTAILYIKGIVQEELVKTIKEKLNKINIDGIIDSSYLKNSLEETTNIFPTLIATERPDKVTSSLLEGKVAIIVENSPYAIILPAFFIDFFHSPDDYYQKNINTTFIRIIRFCAFIISIFTPAIYLIVTTRNYNLIPLKLLITLKAGRSFVPFPAYIEALFMIICFEILKESDLRMSKTSGSAISILGGLILGDAAVSAGIVSPIMIIVIAISSISGLMFQSIELSNSFRLYKVITLLLSTILGLNGLLISITIIIYKLLTTKTINKHYLSPIIPFDKNEIKDSLIKLNNNKRTKILTKNIKRGKYKWKKYS